MILVLLLTGSLLYHKHHEDVADHNLKTLRDSVTTLQLKNGDYVSTINSYILEKEQLTEYLDISKKEIKDLEKKLGDLAYVSNIESNTIYKTVYTRDTVYITGDTTIIGISYSDDWLTLGGRTTLYQQTSTTVFDSIYVPCPLRVGLTDDYRIWVEPKNPYMHITDIEGAVINGSKLHQKKKRWNVGVQVGFGAQYGIVHKTLDVGPYIGVGLSYGFDF